MCNPLKNLFLTLATLLFFENNLSSEFQLIPDAIGINLKLNFSWKWFFIQLEAGVNHGNKMLFYNIPSNLIGVLRDVLLTSRLFVFCYMTLLSSINFTTGYSKEKVPRTPAFLKMAVFRRKWHARFLNETSRVLQTSYVMKKSIITKKIIQETKKPKPSYISLKIFPKPAKMLHICLTTLNLS